MAADKRTAYLQAYIQLVLFIPFLSTFFRTNPRDIVNAESMKIDIKRGTRKMAPVISNITQRGGKIEKSQYTQKEFTPPVVALGGDFAPGDLIEKVFGVDEYTSAGQEYMVQLMNNIMDTMMEIEGQINRTIEYQAAQILQTGEVYLYDDQGNIAYSIDYYPKATHFPTVTIPWSDEDSDPDTDISNLIDVIRKDGKVKIRNIIFGKTALDNYLRNTKVDDKFDITRINSGIYNPREINDDVKLLGELLIGTDRLMAYVYEGLYDHPSTGTVTNFVDPEKVILLPDPQGMNVDMRKTYCRVPTITGIDPRFAGIVPTTMNLENRSYTPRVWADGNADSLNVELKTRPLLIPVSIDAFGCLTTEL
jgi:hypothetical protein